MKTISDVTAKHIISEPGDATRYDYIVAVAGPDEFVFAGYNNTFAYPTRINYWDVRTVTDVHDEVVTRLAEKYQCNPWTVMECIRTVKELYR